MGDNIAFVSGNEAVAIGVRLIKPHVISAYPITPQTIVVEKLAEFVEDGSLVSEFIHVESEHSALTAALGASSIGARAFTATSSQGLLYMAEVLHYVSGARLPIVMMNANRSIAVPWNIFGDQRDSLSLLDCGWIQVYVEDAQEALDMIIQAYKIAENQQVLTPVMVNLDGFVLTHTYELVEIPQKEDVDSFLPLYKGSNKMDLDNPRNLCMSVGPNLNTEFRYQQHLAMMDSVDIIQATDNEFSEKFGRAYGGMVEEYFCDDAEVVLLTIGSISGTVRVIVDMMREQGFKVGMLKIRYLRPFPINEIIKVGKKVKAIGVLEKNISFGFEGTVFTNVNSALSKLDKQPRTVNYIAGLGGRDITKEDIKMMFDELLTNSKQSRIEFVGLKV